MLAPAKGSMTFEMRYTVAPADPSTLKPLLGDLCAKDDPMPPLSIISMRDIAIGPEVTASDAFIIDARPLPMKVPAGRHRLELIVADEMLGEHNAFAMLRFSDAPVERWEPARLPDVEGTDGEPSFWYCVDIGYGSFGTPGSSAMVYRATGDPIWAALKDVTSSRPLHVITPEGSFVLFSTWDGSFVSYFGYDAHGDMAVLMTDFQLLAWSRRPDSGVEP